MVVLFLILEAKKEKMQTIREKRMLHILCFTVFICMEKKGFWVASALHIHLWKLFVLTKQSRTSMNLSSSQVTLHNSTRLSGSKRIFADIPPVCLHLKSSGPKVVVLDGFSPSFVRGLSKGKTVTWWQCNPVSHAETVSLCRDGCVSCWQPCDSPQDEHDVVLYTNK